MRLGRLELIAGSMFSGKTGELIRRIYRYHIAKRSILLFRPKIDDRSTPEVLDSHDGIKNDLPKVIGVESVEDILSQVVKYKNEFSDYPDVVGVDEVQFLKPSGKINAEIFNNFANSGVIVVVAGLDLDSSGEEFGLGHIMSVADDVTKLKAVCVRCFADAHYSYRMSDSNNQIEIGGKELYSPLCRRCYMTYRNSKLIL